MTYALLTLLLPCAAETTIYVSPDGHDTASGRSDDMPVQSLAHARDLCRAAADDPKTIVLADGTHRLAAPLELGPQDSGLTIRAADGAHPVISGGAPITRWTAGPDGLQHGRVPALVAAVGVRQMRVGDEPQTLARYPNADPDQPITGGWLFAKSGAAAKFAMSVSNIHNKGDWIEWQVEAPADGEYLVWLYIGHNMQAYNRPDMGGASAFQVDGGADVPLMNLPDTGGWTVFRWNQSAKLDLSAGPHRIRWTNRTGGGLNFNAFALTTDPDWQPESTDLPKPAAGRALIVVQGQEYETAHGPELQVTAGDARGKPDELPYGVGDLPDRELAGGQVAIFPAWGWVGGPVQIGGVDREQRILKLTGKNTQQDIRLGNRYRIENVRQALDQPGEFWLDATAGELLYQPARADFADQPVIVPLLDRLITISGDEHQPAKDIHLEGLRFRDARYSTEVGSLYTPDDAAIHLDGAQSCEVRNCDFRHLGGYAVRLASQSFDCKVLGCTMTDLGQGGVIAVGDGETQCTDCVVAGCTMQRLGKVYQHVAGVYVTTGSRFRVAHNTISDVPRYGISFKSFGAGNASHDCIAEYNDLRRTNLETNDTGAIETLGRDRAPCGHVIRFNLILDVVGLKTTPEGQFQTPYYTWGIYLDDYSSGETIFGNVVARTVRGAYHNHLGFGNTIENNIFVDGQDQQLEFNGNDQMVDNVVRRNIVVFSRPEAAYLRSRPWNEQVLKACDQNLVWCSGGAIPKSLTPAGDWAAWRAAGHDSQGMVADPKFVDPEHDDYRLQPDSPALALGFEPIPFQKIGVQGYDPQAW